jgi:hypothetical protein
MSSPFLVAGQENFPRNRWHFRPYSLKISQLKQKKIFKKLIELINILPFNIVNIMQTIYTINSKKGSK